MKKALMVILFSPLLLILSGCLTTLHPIFTEKELVAGNQLTGNWKNVQDGRISIYRKASKDDLKQFSETLQQNSDRVYVATIYNGQDEPPSEYYAFLVELDHHFYLDYYPADTRERASASAFVKSHYIPMHGVYRIDFSPDGSFQLKQLDAGFLEKLIKNKQIRLPYEELDDGGYFITASTTELQQYLIKYRDTPEAYGNNNPQLFSRTN
jgi:acylphosphatase